MNSILKRDLNRGSLHQRRKEKGKEVTEKGRKEMTERGQEAKVWRREKNQRTEELSLHIRQEQGLIGSQTVTDLLKETAQRIQKKKKKMRESWKEHLKEQKSSKRKLVKGKELGVPEE